MSLPQCATVGIVANPASGRDIRRLTAKASVFPTVEKANMVQRVLSACGALGVVRVLMMPDMTGIAAGVKRAVDAHRAEEHMPWPVVEFLDMAISESARDTAVAVQAMVERGVGAIVVLGGDGTHRIVSMHCGEVPIATLSSGTNNAFPDLREATTTGFAAALVATGRVPEQHALRRTKRLRVTLANREEFALVDACVTSHQHIGARALWQPDALRELYVTFAEPDTVGLSAVAGLIHPVGRGEPRGLRVRFADGASANGVARVIAPIAPGLFGRLAILEWALLEPGVRFETGHGPGTVALDGERELEFGAGERVAIRLELDGPRVVDVPQALHFAATHRLLFSETN